MSQTLQAQLWDVSNIEAPPWNPNVMSDEDYARLKADMKEHGPASIDPIKCYHKTIVQDAPAFALVTYDGAHRLRAAKELGWKQVYVIVDASIHNEEEARVVNYRKNTERGRPDPFKETEMFEWFVTVKKWTHEQVAKEFGVDRTTVTKRLTLRQLDEKVRESALSDKSRNLTVSHLEPLAVLSKEEQQKAYEEVNQQSRYSRSVSVRDVEAIAKAVKDRSKKEKEFRETVERSTWKTCPVELEKGGTCGKEPERGWRNLPWVQCSSGMPGHVWNLKTGKTERQIQAEERAKVREKNPPKKEPPHTIKTTHTVEEFRAAATNFIKQLVASMTSIHEIFNGLTGAVGDGGKEAIVEYSQEDEAGKRSMRLDYEETGRRGGIDDTVLPSFTVTEKTWKSKEFEGFNAEVDFGYCSSEKELDQNAKKVVAWFEKHYTGAAKKPTKGARKKK